MLDNQYLSLDLRNSKNYTGFGSNPYVTSDKLAFLSDTKTTNIETPSIA